MAVLGEWSYGVESSHPHTDRDATVLVAIRSSMLDRHEAVKLVKLISTHPRIFRFWRFLRNPLHQLHQCWKGRCTGPRASQAWPAQGLRMRKWVGSARKPQGSLLRNHSRTIQVAKLGGDACRVSLGTYPEPYHLKPYRITPSDLTQSLFKDRVLICHQRPRFRLTQPTDPFLQRKCRRDFVRYEMCR